MKKLNDIRERAETATAGPWEVFWYGGIQSRSTNKTICHGAGPEGNPNPDADLIAHAREDIPRLVKALRAVERLGNHSDETHAELPLPHGRFTQGYDMAIRDGRAAIRKALG